MDTELPLQMVRRIKQLCKVRDALADKYSQAVADVRRAKIDLEVLLRKQNNGNLLPVSDPQKSEFIKAIFELPDGW